MNSYYWARRGTAVLEVSDDVFSTRFHEYVYMNLDNTLMGPIFVEIVGIPFVRPNHASEGPRFHHFAHTWLEV